MTPNSRYMALSMPAASWSSALRQFRRHQRAKRIVIVDPGFTRKVSTLTEALFRRSNEALDPDMDDRGRLVLPGPGAVEILRSSAERGIPDALDRLRNG